MDEANCSHTHMCTHRHTYIYTHVCTHKHAHTHMFAQCMHTHTHMHIYYIIYMYKIICFKEKGHELLMQIR